MPIARRLVTVVAVLDLAVLGGGVIAAAVKDDGSSSSAKAPSPPPSTSAAAPTSAATSAPPSTAAPSSAAPSTVPAVTHAPPAPASTATTAATTAAPPVGSVSVGTSAPATHPTTVVHPTTAKPKPTARATSAHVSGPGAVPGTYAETSTGTITIGGGKQDASGSATLVVDKAQGTDQKQSSKSDQSATDEIVRFGVDGSVKLTFLHIANQAFDETFHFAAPEPLLPANPAAGMTYSWTAPSDSGKTTLTVTGTIKGREDVTIGGKVVHCLVVHAALKMTGATTVTVDQTEDYAPAYKLVVRDHQIASGKYSVLSYTADITTTLVRLTPQ